MKTLRKTVLTVALAAYSPTPVLACAACYGKSSDPLAHGMNWGIFTLLAVVATMLASIASFFIFIIRRGAALASNSLHETSPSAALSRVGLAKAEASANAQACAPSGAQIKKPEGLHDSSQGSAPLFLSPESQMP